jgi:hypothetical protein
LGTRLNNNFVNGGNVGKYYYYQPMARWDHIFSEKDKLNFTFTFQHGQEYRDSTGFGPPAGSGDVGSQRTDQNYIISWTHVVSPTTLLDVRASYGRFTSYFPRWTDFSLTAADVGMTQMITAPSTDLKSVPRIQMGDFTGLFASVGGDLFTWSTNNTWNLAPSLTMTRGRHTLRFGGEVHYYAVLRPNPVFQDGRYRSDQLQLKVEKRVLGGGGGLTFGLSYTLAKAFEKNHRLNNWNTAEDTIYELDNTDKTHNLAIYGVWDLPFGKSRRFNVGNPVGGALLNNWSFDWILTYVNGNPVGWPDLINKCGTWKATEQDENHWFNNDKTCYQKFPGFNVRTTPDRFPDIREQQKPQLNLSLSRTFALTERYKFLLR